MAIFKNEGCSSKLNSKSNQKKVIWNKKEKKTALFFPPERWKEPFSGDRTRPERATLVGVVSLSNQINERAQVQNNNNINEGAQQSQQEGTSAKQLRKCQCLYFLLSFSTNLYCCSVASQVTWFLAIWIPVVLFRFPHAIPSVNKYFCIFVNIKGLNCFLLPFYWPMNMFSKIHGYNHWLGLVWQS